MLKIVTCTIAVGVTQKLSVLKTKPPLIGRGTFGPSHNSSSESTQP
jgi:hypothetical protein